MQIRMTVRDALWLFLFAAVALTWWIDHQRLEATIDRCKQNFALAQLSTAPGPGLKFDGPGRIVFTKEVDAANYNAPSF